jgi:hypothetical protein
VGAEGVVLLLYADAVDWTAVLAADELVILLEARLSDAGVCRGGFATWWPRSVNVGVAMTESFGCSERTSLNKKRKSRPYSWSSFLLCEYVIFSASSTTLESTSEL